MAQLQSTSVTGSLGVSGSIEYSNIHSTINPPAGTFGESGIFKVPISDGTLDVSFNTSASSYTYEIITQPDDKILIGGTFTIVSGSARNRIARLNADGTLDTGFDPNVNDEPADIKIQSDGKILVGGVFTSVGGTSINRIARLNTDGTLDTGFNPGTGANNYVIAIAIQSDGKIIVGGDFTNISGSSINRIARLNGDGTVDGSFNPGTGANDRVDTIAIQSDGKILVGGEFTSVSGSSINRIVRLNTDGTVDGSFNPGTGANNIVRTTAIQPDGKILIGGDFTSVSGSSINRIARLNEDGTVDTGFNPGTGANNDVEAIAIQPDDKILIVGQFTTVGGTTRNRIARLNTDGTLSGGFNPNVSSTASTVSNLTFQSDGKILICGNFTNVGGTTRYRMARLAGVTTTYGLYLYTTEWKLLGNLVG